jgi:hypothetical protein
MPTRTQVVAGMVVRDRYCQCSTHLLTIEMVATPKLLEKLTTIQLGRSSGLTPEHRDSNGTPTASSTASSDDDS